MFKPITTKLAGVSFGDAQENIKKFGCQDIGSYALIREPDNSHDANAIKVSLFDIWFMGYVPKVIAKDIAPMMDAGRMFDANLSVSINTAYLTERQPLRITLVWHRAMSVAMWFSEPHIK